LNDQLTTIEEIGKGIRCSECFMPFDDLVDENNPPGRPRICEVCTNSYFPAFMSKGGNNS
jgi:hypothetical protein